MAMRAVPKGTALTAVALSGDVDFFGPAPLISGEDPAAYEALQKRVAAAVQPKDVLEEIWVRDAVDLVWETLRLRRLKAALLRATAHQRHRENSLAACTRKEIFV